MSLLLLPSAERRLHPSPPELYRLTHRHHLSPHQDLIPLAPGSLGKGRANVQAHPRAVHSFCRERQTATRIHQRADESSMRRAEPVEVVLLNGQRGEKESGAGGEEGEGGEKGRGVVPARGKEGGYDAVREVEAGRGRGEL